MPPPLALFLALLAASHPALPREPAQIRADELTFDKGTGLSRATGHVVVTSQGLVLRAPALTDDTAKGRLVIEGPLLAVDGLNVLVARHAVLEAATGETEFLDFELHEKEKVSAAALAEAQTPDQARALGVDHAVIRGRRLLRVGPAHYRIDALELTTCQCQGACRPAWSMTARSADVEAGERAWLLWPEVEVAGIPIPLLRPPALYIPLSDRRTGFLLPHLAWQSQNGLILDEPFFLTLGRSYDVTASAGYVFGVSESGAGAAGVEGPRGSLELRYAPTADTEGRLFASVLDDFHHDFDATGTGYVRGPRESLHFWHLQGDEGPWGDRADVSLVSDARLTGQLTTDILYASIPATRSAADAFYRSSDWLVSADAVYLQDFQGYFSPSNVHELLFGPGSPATVATLPRLQADLADRRLGPAPVWLSLSSTAAREGPLGSPYDRLTLGPTTAFNALAAGSGQITTSTWQPGRAAVDKVDVLPTLYWPVLADRFVTASLSAGWREDLWYFESNPNPSGPSPGQTGQRGYPILDAQVGTRLARTFGTGWNHSIEPGVEARYLPAIETSGVVAPLWLIPAAGAVLDHATGLPIALAVPLPYDELDFAPGLGAAPTTAAPGTVASGLLPSSLAQGVLHVDQRLVGPALRARLDLGEYLDLAGAEATYGLLQSSWGSFHLNGYALFSNQPLPCPGCNRAATDVRRLEQATADAGWADARGDSAGLTFFRTVAAGSALLNAPADALFAPTLAPSDPRWALPDVSQATAGGTARVWDGLSVHAGLSYLVTAEVPIQVTAGAGYRSPQSCLALDGTFVLQPSGPGQPLGLAAFFLTFDLGEIGGGGAL
ncbi:MAG TPA: hypothetical protein VMB50_07420 [Myxococcales bacterium]|nr:hypothetical protein [Myxococcales bacterium]